MVIYKSVSQKNCFLYVWKMQWLSSAKDHAHVLTYTKGKKIAKRFYIQKSRHFKLRKFHENFKLGIYIKITTLCVTWPFNIQKALHFAKSKTICVKFLYTKFGHFVIHDFHGIFEIVGAGGHFYIRKIIHFALHFYIKKKWTLRYGFIYIKSSY